MSEQKISADKLRRYVKEIFLKAGLPEEEAYINADNLVEADLTGVESHGISRVPQYLARLRQGGATAQLKLKVVSETPSTLLVDGCNSLGASVSHKVMNMVIEKAKNTGIAFASVKNSNHFGSAAYFTKMALKNDMIGFSGANAVPRMAPWGGTEAYFGTNPFSVAIPAGKERPIVVDMATSVVARGKISVAAKKGDAIPVGWALDKNGQSTTDAKEGLLGTVLPFGGPKGSAIALIIEVLSGVLAGAEFTTRVNDLLTDFDKPTHTSHYFIAIDIKAISPVNAFKENIDIMIQEIKSNPPASDVREVFVPGEIEWRKREERLQFGIPVSHVLLADLKKEGDALGVSYTLD